MNELKYYGLESRNTGHQYNEEWRYYSFYNGARGAWRYNDKLACKDGEAHKALIIALHTRGGEAE